MQLFYGRVEGEYIVLEADEARHAAKVLRKKEGDNIEVITGDGNLYFTQIILVQKNKILAQILKTNTEFGLVPYELHVAIAPTKNIDRFEWFLEKATEMGVTAIHPILTHQSERKVIKQERLQRILVAATKQSLKGTIPTLHSLKTWPNFLEQDFKGDKFIAHCEERGRTELTSVLNTAHPTLICIGPEGDFTPTEVEQAIQSNFIPVALGSSRLRTETAGVYAVSLMYGKSSHLLENA